VLLASYAAEVELGVNISKLANGAGVLRCSRGNWIAGYFTVRSPHLGSVGRHIVDECFASEYLLSYL
jgi:hypothetical protein